MRCEARTLDDIRALGGNDLADERRFEAAARVSEINLALYRAFVQPWVKAAVTPPMAEAMRRMHPLRLSYEMFGPRNPFLAWIGGAAEQVRAAPPAGAVRQRAAGGAGAGLAADRRRARGLAQGDGEGIRGDLPRDLRRAGAAGGARHRHELSPAAAQGGEEPAARGAGRGAQCRASPGAGSRRAARGACPRAPLRRNGARRASTSAASRRSAGSAARTPTTAPCRSPTSSG